MPANVSTNIGVWKQCIISQSSKKQGRKYARLLRFLIKINLSKGRIGEGGGI
jgi:hypothetical protein